MQLNSSYKDLQPHWEEVQDCWNDVVRRDFAKAYLDPLEEEVQMAMRALDQLAEVMARMKHECE
jgi:hypothetical protein